LVLLISAVVPNFIDFAPSAQHLKLFFRSNFPEINHSRKKMIAHPIISLARISFRASILPATKKLTAQMQVQCCEVPHWSGLLFDDFDLTCAPVCGPGFGSVSL